MSQLVAKIERMFDHADPAPRPEPNGETPPPKAPNRLPSLTTVGRISTERYRWLEGWGRDRPPPSSEPDPLLGVQDEVFRLASLVAAAQGRILSLLAEHGDDLTGGDDHATWLAWACGLKPSAAKAQVRVADRLGELPAIKEALEAGEISLDKTETLVRVAVPETEDMLLTWAKNGTCAQLQSISAAFRRATVEDGNRAHAQRDLSYYFTDDGIFRLRAQMSSDDGAVVAKAIEAVVDQLIEEQKTFADDQLPEELGTERDLNQARSRGALRTDALVAMSESYLQHGLGDGLPQRYQVMVHVDEATLQSLSGTSEIEEAGDIPVETAQRIACDCSILGLLEKDGVPLRLGRANRTISPGLRKALKARDKCCVWPGCSNTRFTDGHHIVFWGNGGGTDLENLALLCRRHHRLLHEGGYRMETGPGGFRFFRPEGEEIPPTPTARSVTEVELEDWKNAHAVRATALVALHRSL